MLGAKSQIFFAPQAVMRVTAAILRVKIDGSGYGFDRDGGTNSRLTFTNDAELYVHLISRF